MRSRRRARTSSIMTSSGVRRSACRPAGLSAFSTALIMKRWLWCASIRKCWRARSCQPSSSAKTYGRSVSKTLAPLSDILPATVSFVLKFFLHISKEEQRRRLLARLDEPAKQWKFSMNDVAERKLWNEYMDAYEAAIRATSSREAPWHVVPADHKWFARLIVARATLEALENLDLRYPKIEG